MLNDRPKLAATELILGTPSCSIGVFRYQLVDATVNWKSSSSIGVFRYQLVDVTVNWKSSTYEDVNVSVCSPSGCRDLTYIMNSKGDSGNP